MPNENRRVIAQDLTARNSYVKGLNLYLSGDVDGARSEWMNTLMINPNFNEAMRGLQRIDTQRGLNPMTTYNLVLQRRQRPRAPAPAMAAFSSEEE